MSLTRHRRARGVMLMEVLIVLGMLVIFMIVTARLFTSLIRLSQQSSEHEARLSRYDSAVRALRTDAWGATQISVNEAGAVAFAESGGKSMIWRSDESGALARSETTAPNAPPREQRWPELGGRLRFRVEGPVLVVTGDERSGRAGELRLVSQVLLAGVTP